MRDTAEQLAPLSDRAKRIYKRLTVWWLNGEGCTLGQGYLFGRAQPAGLVPAMLERTGAVGLVC